VAKASDGDLYEVLGVARDAGQDEIKSAYRAAAKKFHPDAEGNSYFFRLIQQAYETLSDPARRADYDRSGRPAPPTPQAAPTYAEPDHRWATEGPSVPAIPLEEITWWARVDPGSRIRWRARFAPAELLFVLVGGLWVVLVVLGFATSNLASTGGGYGYLVFGLAIAPTVWCLLSALFGRKPAKAAVLWSIVTGVALLLLTYFAETHHISHPGNIAGYALGALVVPWLAARFAPYRTRQRIDWKANVWQLRGAGQGTVVRSENAAGLTADLLARYLTRIPAVRIFRDPAGVGPGVDHLVLCGRRMLLISSVAWPAGHYTVGRAGEILLDGQPVVSGSVGIAALRICRRRFRRAQVRGVVVNWPPRGQYLVAGWAPDQDYAVTSPDALVKDVGNWLADQPTMVHRGMFRALLGARR